LLTGDIQIRLLETVLLRNLAPPKWKFVIGSWGSLKTLWLPSRRLLGENFSRVSRFKRLTFNVKDKKREKNAKSESINIKKLHQKYITVSE
jgi:hypothetical protein